MIGAPPVEAGGSHETKTFVPAEATRFLGGGGTVIGKAEPDMYVIILYTLLAAVSVI